MHCSWSLLCSGCVIECMMGLHDGTVMCRYPAMGKAASKQHRTGGPDSDKQHGSRDQEAVHTGPHEAGH